MRRDDLRLIIRDRHTANFAAKCKPYNFKMLLGRRSDNKWLNSVLTTALHVCVDRQTGSASNGRQVSNQWLRDLMKHEPRQATLLFISVELLSNRRKLITRTITTCDLQRYDYNVNITYDDCLQRTSCPNPQTVFDSGRTTATDLWKEL